MNNITHSKLILKHIEETLSPFYERNEARSIGIIVLEHQYKILKTDILSNKVLAHPLEEVNKTLSPIIERLIKHEPIQYILGETEFYGCRIKVNPSVLIPRPETEELANLIIRENQDALNCLDLCTGSGCIAIALSKGIRNSKVYAVDISESAINTAKTNAILNDTSIQAEVIDIMNNHLPWQNKFDLIVSNPPYIEESEKVLMKENVLIYEPSIALFVEGNDPLIFYKRITEIAKNTLNRGGALYFEINERFGMEVRELMLKANLKDVIIIKDLNGKDRFVKGFLI